MGEKGREIWERGNEKKEMLEEREKSGEKNGKEERKRNGDVKRT